MKKPVQKFVVALCPVTPRYYRALDHSLKCPRGTTVKSEALIFDTYEEAKQLATNITGWGGAQRIEDLTVHVEVADLSTPKGRIEVRNACMDIWENEGGNRTHTPLGWESVRSTVTRVGAEIVRCMRLWGLRCAIENRGSEDGGDSCADFMSVYLSDTAGNVLSLCWDPMVDGLDYPTSGEDGTDIDESMAQYEREPDDTEPDATEMLRRQVVDSHHNAIARIYATYLKSLAAADDVLRCALALLDQEPTAMCDGCEKRYPECDVETHTMGDESMALCEQCKQRDHAHRTDS